MAYTLDTFRRESVIGFEQKQSLLRRTVVSDGIREGLTYKFLVSDANGIEATTRGVGGDVVYGGHNRDQYTATMSEKHGTDEKTGFNIFTSQGNTAKAMQDGCYAKINRAIDNQIIATLNTGTITAGTTAIPATFKMFQKALAKLGNAKVPNDGQRTALITPAFLAYMMEWPQFKSADEVSTKPMVDGGPAWDDSEKFYRWQGMNIIVHPQLPGVGTSAEVCFVYHKNAVGHAFAMDQEKIMAEYEAKHDRSWARMTAYIGSALLQDDGIVKINHDGSEFA